MTRHNQAVGAWGEETAAVWLAGRGYEVRRRNVRTPYGEIDIIAYKNNIAILVEVKTLTSSRNFYPEHQITARKREHMLNAAQHYAAENEIDHWQIDVIAIEGRPGDVPVITHFENAL
ncbi:MAG TPA: YraN family protein [Anaerolineales bacterium]|nr:YraN family protein [Anaerolineales bacterium]HNC08793.1 YraN family protein [Anaerolineales bacterium]